MEAATDCAPGWLKERTLTSLEDVYEKLRQGGSGGSAGPQEAYRQQCDRLKAALARVCLLQLSDARVRLCFYYPHDRQAAAFLKALRLNPNLLELNLKDNGFDSKAKLTRLSRLLEDHGTIARLNLSQNRLTGGPSLLCTLR
ncbi:hypothetical protein BOX15_Mlig020742g1 [Macrostomum lignano]|uniref:Uncharacterized protein n=1 Tax=Macrostomum lignano TaxID=282301 RepID=A0A267H9D6_9PLAT|nr:hypothetical protein BOX15_Mlig020742g1 [Macrostomum lignano]